MTSKKTLKTLAALALGATALTGCSSAADVASYNLSEASDNFEVNRRIVFINGITDKYMFEIEGRCSIEVDNTDQQLVVTCKTGEGKETSRSIIWASQITSLTW